MHLALLHDGHPALLRVDGPPTAPVALFFHPFPLHADAWEDVLRACAEAGLCAAALDAPGFGGTPALGAPLTMEALARLGAAALDALGARRAAIAGCSMGGYAAMAFARLFPERVESLALIATRASPDSPEAKATRESQAQAALAQGPQAVTDAMVPKLLAPRPDPQVRARVEALAARATAQGVADALRGMALRPDAHDALRTLAAPALVLGGEHDAIIPRGDVEKLASTLPDATLQVIGGAGHLLFLEKPEQVIPVVVSHLRDRRLQSLDPA